ncbi:MAG: ATP-binding protein [Pseudomonadota bacterium]
MAVQQNQNQKIDQDKRQALPRLVADANGVVLYANDAFNTLTRRDSAIEKGENILNILIFQDMEDVFHGAWMGNDPEDVLAGLFDGEHHVSFGTGMRPVPLQFNWVDMVDGKRFLVASSIAENQKAVDDLMPMLGGEKPGGGEDVEYFDTDDMALNHFLDMSHEVLCTLQVDGAFEWMNDTFCAALKTDGTVLGQKTFVDLVHPDERNVVRQTLSNLNHDMDGQIVNLDCRMIASDGDVLSAQWRLKKTDGQIYCVGQDVTDIKRHENTLKQQQDKLLEAEAIGKMGHWHWRLGEDHFEWSDEIYRIFGQDRNAFIPTIDSMNTMIHSRDVSRIMQVFQRAMIENKDYELDFKINRPSGAICYVRLQGRCETDMDGDVIGLYGIMQDITQDTLREEDLREAKEAAERAYAAKSRFLANMSHELRTPLNAIIGFSEMIQNQLLGPIGNDRYLEYIGGIRESGGHLLDLISDILDMSKIEAGKYQLDLEKFSIAKVVRMAVHMMEGRAVDSSIKMIVDIDDEELQIIADRRALMQMLLNLLSNSVKFSGSNTQIRVTCRKHENFVQIDVADNGIGIPSHKLQTIMKPFEQVSSEYTRDHEGSGLGLAITKELIEMHGGKIEIESVIDQGTTVSIRLPYDASQERA